MWEWLASRVLRNRTAILIGVLVVTVFMGYMATTVGMSYKHGGLLPKTDSAYVEYERFKERFGEDGNTIVVGAEPRPTSKRGTSWATRWGRSRASTASSAKRTSSSWCVMTVCGGSLRGA